MTPWTISYQAPLFIGFPRREYWSGLSFLSLADFPDPGIELMSPTLTDRILITEPLGKPDMSMEIKKKKKRQRIASPGSVHDTGCLGLVHWDNPEGWYGEGGGRGIQDGEHVYTCGGTC